MDNPNKYTEEELDEYYYNFENPKPHQLSISGGGELNVDEYDSMVAMESLMIYGIGPQTRVTLIASCDITLSGAGIYYGSFEGWGYLTKFSHETGEYFQPFNIEFIKTDYRVYGDDGTHNVLVYTLDGKAPQLTSNRYDGTPIRLDRSMTVQTATILGNGALVAAYLLKKPIIPRKDGRFLWLL